MFRKPDISEDLENLAQDYIKDSIAFLLGGCGAENSDRTCCPFHANIKKRNEEQEKKQETLRNYQVLLLIVIHLIRSGGSEWVGQTSEKL